jgi:hypothetical protein
MFFKPLRPRSDSFSGHAAAVAVASVATLASACSDYEVTAICGTQGAPACSGTVLWVETIRGDGEPVDPNNKDYGELVSAIAVDESGGIVATGFANATMILGAPVGAELLLAPYDASGSPRQNAQFAGPGTVLGAAAGVDPEGNTFIGGVFNGSLNLQMCPLDSMGGDGFLALLDPKLSCMALRGFPGLGTQAVRALDIGPDGNAVVAGTFDQEIDLDGEVIPVEGAQDSFVAALDEMRSIRWSAIVKGQGTQEITGLAHLPDGDVVITGWFDQSIAIGDGAPQTITGFGNVFLARLSGADGSVKWIHHYGDTSGQVATSVATGPEGQIAIVGKFGGILEISGITLENAEIAVDSAYVALFDSDGNVSWAKALGGANQQRANAVDINEAGDVLVGGSFVESIALGSNTYKAPPANAEEAFVAKLGAKDGAPVWFHALGGADHQAAYAVAFAGDGAAYVGGAFRGTMTGGSKSVESLDRLAGFVAKIAP